MISHHILFSFSITQVKIFYVNTILEDMVSYYLSIVHKNRENLKSMKKIDLMEEEIRAQRKMIHRLKREIFGIDKTVRSRYIREFNSELKDFRRISSPGEILKRAANRDVIYIGDYHPLVQSQQLVLLFMKEVVKRGRKVVLGMEMLYTRQQELLDRWMKGKMPEEEFLSAIEYKHEWGFNWESFREIFRQARDPFMPVFGIDAELRDHLQFIRRRDRMIARRLVNIKNFFPRSLLMVVIGESHLASCHLPAEVDRLSGGGLSRMTILQNCDEIYWRLLRDGTRRVKAVQIDKDRYCFFTASPMEKYQSYRDILGCWSKGEDSQRCLTEFGEMVETMISFIPGSRKEIFVSVSEGTRASLKDMLPEVMCRQTYHAFSAFLRHRGFSSRGVAATLENLRNYGVVYLPGFNVILVVKFGFDAASHEAGRFVVRALRNRIGGYGRSRLAREDRFYAFDTH